MAKQRLTSATNFGNGTESYTHNADGTWASNTDANGNQKSYNFDAYQGRTAILEWPPRSFVSLINQSSVADR